MITYLPLNHSHYPLLLPIIQQYEPFAEKVTMEQMVGALRVQEGWSIWDSDSDSTSSRCIGYVSLSNFRILHSVTIHATIHPDYHKKWIRSKRLLHFLFNYLFGEDGLSLIKVYSYAVPFRTYRAAKLLDALGFQREGIDRWGGITPTGELYDIVRYGMLKSECKWLRKEGDGNGNLGQG